MMNDHGEDCETTYSISNFAMFCFWATRSKTKHEKSHLHTQHLPQGLKNGATKCQVSQVLKIIFGRKQRIRPPPWSHQSQTATPPVPPQGTQRCPRDEHEKANLFKVRNKQKWWRTSRWFSRNGPCSNGGFTQKCGGVSSAFRISFGHPVRFQPVESLECDWKQPCILAARSPEVIPIKSY